MSQFSGRGNDRPAMHSLLALKVQKPTKRQKLHQKFPNKYLPKELKHNL
tara:strand:+ start:278 stop:424 length:147 start_codon:yes stop_codon:yes gene_type:complete